jgi:FAD/FMN-containing dehydrogenase
VIGIKVALADGTMIKAGGKVVKNVAGYDLCKLFIGAKHTLGVLVEATFKLRPLPEEEVFVKREIESFDELEDLRSRLITITEPVLFDALNMRNGISAWAAFAGNREDVAEQVGTAEREGFRRTNMVNFAEEFWNGELPMKESVLPSRTVATLRDFGADEWLAHLGNGGIFYRGKKMKQTTPRDAVTSILMERVKKAYDPKSIFPIYA